MIFEWQNMQLQWKRNCLAFYGKNNEEKMDKLISL